MKILVINSGSSTVKADVFEISDGTPVLLAKLLVETAGQIEPTIEKIIAEFEAARICTPASISAIGHRVVHGGSKFSAPVLITKEVTQVIEEMTEFAPLHNPANLAGIRYCLERFTVPQVAVFDTAFHQSMSASATTYAIPVELAKNYGIRRYGFHGTSHEYVTRECARRMKIRYEVFNAISLHLGNGASACVVQNGKSIDTSMGFTPLEGLVMGSRCGDIDPSIPFFLQRAAGLSAAAAEALLNSKSGLMGLAGTNDMREILRRSAKGEPAAALAVEIFCDRVRKYIGAYLTYGKPHAVIFTGGIGENSTLIRALTLAGLPHMGIRFSDKKNKNPGPDGLISESDSIPVYVIKTDEELMIAHATWALVNDA